MATASSSGNEPPSLDAMLNSLVYILEAHKAHVKSRRDWALLFAHSYLLATEFSFVGLQQEQQQQQQQPPGRSLMLPAECWSDSNRGEDIVLVYRHKHHSSDSQPEQQSNYILGLVPMGSDLIISLSYRDNAVTCTIAEDLLAPVDASSVAADNDNNDCLRLAYPAVERLHRLLWDQLFLGLAPVRTQQQQQQQRQPRRQQPIPMPHQPLPGSPQPLPQQPMRPQPVNPFDYGRADLDPFGGGGGGGGGMRFDPLRIGQPRRPGQPFFDPTGQPLPPGAVPPGARFDPYGPGVPGQPDPDNLRPPGWSGNEGGFGRGGGSGGFGGNFYM